jgi:[ribosomal protein S5]-alanine N-acetyltransferase
LTGDARALQVGERVLLRRPTASDQDEFLAMVRRSRRLHRPWVHPPESPAEFAAWLHAGQRVGVELHLLCRIEDGAIAGVFNLSEIVRGPMQSAYLGYYGAAPHVRRGYMTEGMELLFRQAFTRYKLHRLEANVQPDNKRSVALATRTGFRREGYSPRYLKVGGRWRDHIRFAILVEDWRAERRGPAPAGSG